MQELQQKQEEELKRTRNRKEKTKTVVLKETEIRKIEMIQYY